ncbi:hypothetical protein C8J57DRAFT_1220930 [Mycena rebaudengoi]|nr:hypothetical protein C8J57DRAFT_1220930 [Mycena rebaudengoi]
MNEPAHSMPPNPMSVDMYSHSNAWQDTPPQNDTTDSTQKLSHQRFGQFGAADETHYEGAAVQVRPGLLSSPQTLYFGTDDDKDQETHHGVMLLNTHLIIHDPLTGAPGSQNGHAYFRFDTAPANEKEAWCAEVPYADESKISDALGEEPTTESCGEEHLHEDEEMHANDKALAEEGRCLDAKIAESAQNQQNNGQPCIVESRQGPVSPSKVAQMKKDNKEKVQPRYPTPSHSPVAIADELPTRMTEKSPETQPADERKRKADDRCVPPPVTDFQSSTAAQIDAPVFHKRGAPISREHYSSSPESAARNISPYERALSFLDDTVTEHSVCSSDSSINPCQVIDSAIAEAQRQLRRKQPRPGPFVGMLPAQPPPSPPHLNNSPHEPVQPVFCYRSALAPGDPRTPAYVSCLSSQQGQPHTPFTWSLVPDTGAMFYHPPALRTKPHAVLPGGRPLSVYTPLDIHSPCPSSPKPHHSILQELDMHEAMPISVPLEEVHGALKRLCTELPFDSDAVRKAVWLNTESWTFQCTQQAKVHCYNEMPYACPRDVRVPAEYQHECANHAFKSCRPPLHLYPLSPDA